VEANFATQLASEPTRGGASLDLLFAKRRTEERCGGWRPPWA